MSDEQPQDPGENTPVQEMSIEQAERQVDHAIDLIDGKDLDGALALLLAVDGALRGVSLPESRIQFARAVNGLGFIQLMAAKQMRASVETFEDSEEKAFRWEIKQALARFDHALASQTDPRYRRYVEGNKAYALMLMDRSNDARSLLRRLFMDHGRAAYDGQLKDLAMNPIPEDRAVRRMIDEIWEETTS